jgi:hypothetical protein
MGYQRTAAESFESGKDRGIHGKRRAQGPGRRAVVEVGEVAQEDDEPFPLRQRCEPGINAVPIRLARAGVGGSRERRRQPCLAGWPSRSCRIQHDPPDPRLEWRVAAEAGTRGDRADEGLLNQVRAARLLYHNRRGDT